MTGLAALKLLGVTAGALLARRGKREEPSNQVSDIYNITFIQIVILNKDLLTVNHQEL